MTKEEQVALEAEKAKAKAEAQDADTNEDNQDESQDDSKEAQNIDKKIDYEAEYKKEFERREAAERVLAENRYKKSEAKRKSAEEILGEGNDDTSEPLTKDDLKAILAEERQAMQKEVQAVRISELAGKMANSDSEAKLIIEIHKGRTFPSYLSLEEQVEESYVIANRKKFLGERNEALRALKNKDNASHDAIGTHQDEPQGSEPNMSSADKQAITAVGYKYNGNNRRYEKKFKNGQMLVYDPKSKQTTLVK